MNNVGLYIHIPFCKSKCAYCNFTSFKCLDKIDEYINCLLIEIGKVLDKNILIDTLYIGGGTPSILRYEDISRIIDKVKESAKFEPREVTIECNPESITLDKINLYKQMGINRVSMGVQSLNDKVLKTIGRIHTAKQAIDSAKIVKNAGLNLSVDMILGLPYSTLDDIKCFIDTFSSIGVNHISAYSLSVEDGTPLDRMVRSGKIILPSEDDALDQYDLAYDMLKNKGYNRYEVSNFARNGYESQHNLKYWQMDKYIGLGVASHSYINGKRYYNTSNLDYYIESIKNDKLPQELEENVTLRDMVEETIMLALRLEKGVCLDKVNKLIGGNFLKINEKNISKVRDYIVIDNGYLRIKPEYMNVMNTIIVDLLS